MIRQVRAHLGNWRQMTERLQEVAKRLRRVEESLAPLARRARAADPLAARLTAIEEQLRGLSDQQELMTRHLRHLLSDVDGLVRRTSLDPDSLEYPERLTARRFRLHSQGQEDGLIWAILQEAGITSRTFIELGSGASGGNAAMLAIECGWSGLMVEGNPDSLGYAARRFPNVTAVAEWIRPDTVNALLERHGFAREVDLLSLDIDGNDYWVWESLTAARPRIVMLEYNSMFGGERSVTIPYDPQFNRREHRFCYYGASLQAMTRLSARKGYRLVAVDPSGVNALFVRHDIATHIPACDPARSFKMKDGYNQFMRDKQFDIFAWAATSGRQLVDVD